MDLPHRGLTNLDMIWSTVITDNSICISPTEGQSFGLKIIQNQWFSSNFEYDSYQTTNSGISLQGIKILNKYNYTQQHYVLGVLQVWFANILVTHRNICPPHRKPYMELSRSSMYVHPFIFPSVHVNL